MDKALYISMTGAKHNMMAQTVHANNLANIGTPGFRGDLAQARSMPVYYGDGHPTRAYALTENPVIDFKIGSMQRTGRDLDVAIEGAGFIAIQMADGSEAYTRAGSLKLDSVGILRTGSGLPVLGSGGPITVPDQEKIEIAIDGTITVLVKGQGPDALAEVNRIKLVNPALSDLKKGTDGLLRLKEGAEAPVDGTIRVVAGFVESSNVNAINEFTEVLSLARQYEMQIKLMKTVERNSEASARVLQIS